MPLFHEHSLVFIHIPKNAGKSIEAAFLGEKAPNSGKRTPINALSKFLLRRTARNEPYHDLLGSLDYTFAAQHMTWHEITSLGILRANGCLGYLPFAVIRNPYDRVISSVLHHFARQIRSGALEIRNSEDFTWALHEWLDEEPRDHNHIAHKRNQFDFLTIDGNSLEISELLRYENLSSDLEGFCNRLGIKPVKLGWEGRNKRDRDYRDYFCMNGKNLLRKHYGKDLDLLGYKF